jgi:hypothetical protein
VILLMLLTVQIKQGCFSGTERADYGYLHK